MGSKEFAVFTLLVTVSLGLISWFADPIWRVAAIVAAASIVWASPRWRLAAQTNDLDASLRVDVLTLLDDLARASQSETQAGNAELDRVKALLQHASDELVRRFGEMNTHIQAQHDLAVSIATTLTAGHADMDDSGVREFARAASDTGAFFVDNALNTSKDATGLLESMQTIGIKANAIAGLLGEIEAISRRTDPLAHPAGITAAHAGAADEIRALAHQVVATVASLDMNAAWQAKQRVQSTLNRIGEIDRTIGVTAQRIDEHAKHVAVGVNAAVTALQFQDVTNQLIGHVQQRLLNIAEIAGRLPAGVRQQAQLRGGLSQARAWLQELRMQQTQRSHPVKQQHMGSGEIELF